MPPPPPIRGVKGGSEGSETRGQKTGERRVSSRMALSHAALDQGRRSRNGNRVVETQTKKIFGKVKPVGLD